MLGYICILLVSRDKYASDASEFESTLVIQTRNKEIKNHRSSDQMNRLPVCHTDV